MALKSDLEARENECSNAEEFTALANEALAEPADKDYARDLLTKGEMQCQFPQDYIIIAEAFALGLEDIDYAKDLLEQAEDACFEGKEFSALGHSIAKLLGDKDKARELLDKAADEANSAEEYLTLAHYAKEDLEDKELANNFIAKVDEQCKTFDDFANLAKQLAEQGNTEAGKTLYTKAARFCGDVPATVSYAEGAKNIFQDDEWARQILDDAETDCQFPKEFVQLAGGYKNLFDDKDKVSELMEQAKDFAMTGEENMDLAEGYWSLLQDKEAAAEAYANAANDLSDKAALLDMAKKLANDLDAKDQAKALYEKVEGMTKDAGDLGKLAQAVIDDLDDKDMAASMYDRAAEKMSAYNELILFAGEIIKNLQDNDKATALYQKALDNIDEYPACIKLLTAVKDTVADKDLARTVIDKASGYAQSSPEYMELSVHVNTILEDKPFAAKLLTEAEDRVTSLDEMRKVASAVKEHFSDDTEWSARIQEKLEKREANQKRYDEFQEIENKATQVKDYLLLADQVMKELDDKFYTRKLFTTAERLLSENPYNVNHYHQLIEGIVKHLNDTEWATRLLDFSATQRNYFVAIRQISDSAVSLLGKENGAALAEKYYDNWVEQLDAAENKTAYDYSKVASALYQDLGNTEKAKGLLDKAITLAEDHLALAHLSQLAGLFGDHAKAEQLLDQAVSKCTSAEIAKQLTGHLIDAHTDQEKVKNTYKNMGEKLSSTQDKLAWIEGIYTIFQDTDWAANSYDELAKSLNDEADKARLSYSYEHHLNTRYVFNIH